MANEGGELRGALRSQVAPDGAADASGEESDLSGSHCPTENARTRYVPKTHVIDENIQMAGRDKRWLPKAGNERFLEIRKEKSRALMAVFIIIITFF